METNILEIALNQARDLSKARSFDEVAEYFHRDIEHIEFPNTLTQNQKIRNFTQLKEVFEKLVKMSQEQNYEILKSYTQGETVVLEMIWTAKLAVPIGNIPVGGELKAYIAQFSDFKDGKIIKQRSYDCFEPFN